MSDKKFSVVIAGGGSTFTSGFVISLLPCGGERIYLKKAR